MSLEDINNIIAPLRRKIIHLVAILTATTLIVYPLTDHVIQKIKADLLPESAQLIYLTPLEGILLKIKISLLIAIAATLPFAFYHIYRAAKKRFNLPALNKTTLALYLLAAILLFLLGTVYAYKFMLPLILQYLYTSAASTGIESLWSIYKFIYLITSLTLLFGLIFELPLIIIALVKFNIVDLDTLSYYRRHAYVALFIIAAIITPPDVLSQIIIALPSILLYEIGLITARIV
jgi:sec-independent protein translocase protein TatC